MLWTAIDAQRLRLAELLADLTDAEWAHPSLCEGWTVRDVAGHLILQTRPSEMLRLAWHARSGVDEAIRLSGIRLASQHTPAQLAAIVKGLAGTRRRIPYATTRAALVDILVHSLDISVPLGRTLAVPPEVTAVAATEIWRRHPGLWRRPDKELIATDVEWRMGNGSRVEAPITDILLLLTGRAH